MDKREFNRKLHRCITMGDADELLKELTLEQLRELYEALETAKEYLGLTFRDQYLLSQIPYTLKEDKFKK